MYTYIQIIIFLILSLLVPIAVIAVAKLLEPRIEKNPVKLSSYESAEEKIGQHKDVTNEYLHYFSIYLAFEISGIMIVSLAFAFVRTALFAYNLISIGIISLALSLIAYAAARMGR